MVDNNKTLIAQNVQLTLDLVTIQQAVNEIAKEIRAVANTEEAASITVRVSRNSLKGWASALSILAGTLTASDPAATDPVAGPTLPRTGPVG